MTNLNIFRRLNIFKRINALEQARARADITIENLQGLLRDQSKWLVSLQSTVTPLKVAKPKAAVKTKPKTSAKTRANRAKYARAYYAKKKAEKAAQEVA